VERKIQKKDQVRETTHFLRIFCSSSKKRGSKNQTEIEEIYSKRGRERQGETGLKACEFVMLRQLRCVQALKTRTLTEIPRKPVEGRELKPTKASESVKQPVYKAS